MKERYEVKFELFNKKMKTTIIAISEEQAKSILMGKIIFHDIKVKSRSPINKQSEDFMDQFKDVINKK